MKKDKTKKVRIILIIIIIVFDFIFLPWILKFPFFLVENITEAPNKWLSYGIIKSYKDIFNDNNFRNLFLIMQLPTMALLLGITWNVNTFKKKNKITNDLGGPDPSGFGQFGTARWQTDKEKDTSANIWLTRDPLKKGGIVLGMEKLKGQEKIWLDDEDVHSLIIGTTRSGKSRRLLLPTIWELGKAGESMVIGDPKGELYITTKEYLKKEGYNIICLDFREPSRGNQWNMLDLAMKELDNKNTSKAVELVWDIAHAIVHQKPSPSTEPIWENGEESVIASIILLTLFNSDFKFQKHMTTAYYLLAELGQPLADETVPLIEYMRKLPVRHPAKDAFATASNAPLKTRASFFTTALADLRLFSDPNIADMTSKQDHVLEDIGINKTAVFLVVPDEKSTRNVLATLYVDQVYQALVDLANKRGGRIPRRVNFVLDEFGNLPSIPNFDKKLTVAGGRGIRFTIAVQALAQLEELYGKKSETIQGNCHNWIYLLTSDLKTAKIISELTGQYTIETEGISSNVQNKGHSFGQSVNMTGRALLMPDEIRRFPQDQSLVLRVRQLPARYPMPDLSAYQANQDFGYVKPSGNIDKDKEKNRKINEERLQTRPFRKVEQPSIWIPDIDNHVNNNEDEETKEININKDSIKDEDINLDIMLNELQKQAEEINDNETENFEEDFL